MNIKLIKGVFAASALYDGLVSIVLLFMGPAMFDYFGVERPNHMGYLHFPALLIILFSVLYWRIASDPVKFKILIPYGIGLKVCYCLVVFFHWATDGIPAMWLPFAWIDVVFLVLFIQAWRQIGSESLSVG